MSEIITTLETGHTGKEDWRYANTKGADVSGPVWGLPESVRQKMVAGKGPAVMSSAGDRVTG